MTFEIDDGPIDALDDAIAAILRRKTPAERVAMIGDAHRTMRLVVAAEVRSRHPEWNEPAVLAEVARRMTRGAD